MTFDVWLRNTAGAGNVDLSGFSVHLDLGGASAGIHYTGVDTSTVTAAYVFGTLQGAPFTFDSFPNGSFAFSDFTFPAPFSVPILPGETLGLARVTYSVDAGTPAGVATIGFGAPTGAWDAGGSSIPLSVVGGSITVSAGTTVPAVPLPSAGPAGLALVVGAAVVRRRRWRV